MAKVSIIVPVYNVEMYLREALDSLVRQTLKDIEIICINDGSKDSSLEIIKEYAWKDKRIVVIDKENGGYGVGMNVGLDRATGEYIGILEPDDYVPLNMYEDLYQEAVANNLDFVKADFYRFTTDDATGDMHLVYNHLDRMNRYYNQVLNPGKDPGLTRFIMNTWSGIYRRSFIEKYHIRHNTTPGASFQDNGFFWQTFIYAERAMFLNKPYYMNRRDNPNSSVNSREKVYCMNIEYDHIRDIFMQKGNEERWERFKYHYNLKKYHNYVFTLGRIGQGFKKEYVERISREFRRARDLEELNMELFTQEEQKRLTLLIENPEEYYRKYWAASAGSTGQSELDKAQKRIRELETSTTYKTGKAVIAIPVKTKNLAKKLAKKVIR